MESMSNQDFKNVSKKKIGIICNNHVSIYRLSLRLRINTILFHVSVCAVTVNLSYSELKINLIKVQILDIKKLNV